jgi:hypothetical protein
VGYGEHVIWPSVVAGAGGAAAPMKSAHVRGVCVEDAIAPQPEAVASVIVIEMPAEGL